MGRIILTIAGPWSKPPTLKTDLEVQFGPADAEFAEDFIFVGRRAQVLDESDTEAIRAHQSILRATAEFDAPGRREWAEKGVDLVLEAVKQGALGVFVETACKAFSPRALERLPPRDMSSLFHFYVEVLGDAVTFSTEGMQAFDLPEVRCDYSADTRDPAQTAVFSMAARMACDGFEPVDDGVFRASESAPLYEVEFQADDDEEKDPFVNVRGTWVMRLMG